MVVVVETPPLVINQGEASALVRKGGWNASNNTPNIPSPDGDNIGHFYVVTVEGTTNVNGISDWKVGDWLVSNGVTWEKIDNTDSITSVAGRTGEVTLSVADVDSLQTILDGKAAVTHTHTLGDLTEKSYNSLTDKPDISSLQTALDGKAPLSSPAFTGMVTLPATTSIGSVSNTEIGYLVGVNSAIQTQLNGKQATITGAATTIVSSNLTASKALVSGANGKVAAASATSTEIGYLVGVNSAIQTQLNGKANTSHSHAISDVTNLQAALDGKHKLFNFTTGTSLTIDGVTYNFHILSVSANSSFSLSNIAVGLLYEFLVKNTGASSITITIPNTADVRISDTVTIASGKAREFSLLYDGTKRYWQVSGELIGA